MNFNKVKFIDTSCAGKTTRNFTKYFHLLALNKTLNQSNLFSILDAMNFQKWELSSDSPIRQTVMVWSVANVDVKTLLVNDRR